MALVKIISNLQSNRLGQMSDIEAFSKGSLLALSISSGLVTISAALIVLQTVLNLNRYVDVRTTLSVDLKQLLLPLTNGVGESLSSSLKTMSESIGRTIDSYSTDSLLKNVK